MLLSRRIGSGQKQSDCPKQMRKRVNFDDALPDITIQVDPSDRLGTLDQLGREAVKLCIISRLRRELVDAFSGSTFLPPTTLNGKCVAGIQWHGRTVLAEAGDFVEAYHRLWRKAVRRFL